VLLVDDDAANIEVLHRLLARAGFSDVIGTTDPRRVSALVQIAEPDIVLLDLHMSRRDGFEVLRDLLPCTRGDHGVPLPVLVLTGDSSAETKRRALGLGAKDFVGKPFDAAEIVLRIDNLLETRRLHSALRAQNVSLESTVAERTRELEEAQEEVLHRLALAGEFRDDDTGQHTQRVGALAARLGQALGLSATDVEVIRCTAPLHDVGKIGVPDSILLKRGRLTRAEIAVMQTHTTIGSAMLAGGRTALLRMSERIARSHHERWDGTGYPDRLAGATIPLEARLVAVADVYDALTSDRPYRSAWESNRVLAHMREGAGSHFDPEVIEVFLSFQGDTPPKTADEAVAAHDAVWRARR
jgi:putative two-component system response regulator